MPEHEHDAMVCGVIPCGRKISVFNGEGENPYNQRLIRGVGFVGPSWVRARPGTTVGWMDAPNEEALPLLRQRTRGQKDLAWDPATKGNLNAI